MRVSRSFFKISRRLGAVSSRGGGRDGSLVPRFARPPQYSSRTCARWHAFSRRSSRVVQSENLFDIGGLHSIAIVCRRSLRVKITWDQHGMGSPKVEQPCDREVFSELIAVHYRCGKIAYRVCLTSYDDLVRAVD